MRLLFLGDVVGRNARAAVSEELPALRDRFKLDFVIVNGENSAGGFGITEKILVELLDAGADVVTSGNHIWDQKETLVYIERHDSLLRPLNFPAGTPGRGAGVFKAKNGQDVLVINAMGRVYMADLDCPFRACEQEISACPLGEGADVIFVDFHAEASSEKQALGHFLDGRVSVVAGTHTHVPTADDHILEGGTGYMTDVGMCGDYSSVLGMDKDEPIQRFVHQIPRGRFEAKLGEVALCGLAVEIDDETGLTSALSPLRMGKTLRPIIPDFWAA